MTKFIIIASLLISGCTEILEDDYKDPMLVSIIIAQKDGNKMELRCRVNDDHVITKLRCREQ